MPGSALGAGTAFSSNAAAASSLLSSYGGGLEAALLPGSAGGHKQKAAEQAVLALVQSLRGCLANLPEKLRAVLELRTGVEVPRALDPAAVAAYLHLPVNQVVPLEVAALERLRLTARAGTCGQTQTGFEFASYYLAETPLSGALGTGGVEGARYSKSASGSGPLSTAGSSGASALGVKLPAHVGRAFFWALVASGGLVLLAFLVADGLGTGPRNRHWRSRWLAAPSRALKGVKPRR